MSHLLLRSLSGFRKNWAQTWTVLHGGVLTFHKDPRSVVPGASVSLHNTDNNKMCLNIVFFVTNDTNFLLISFLLVVNQVRI